MSILCLRPGLQTTVQAGPRRGQRHNGIPAAGAADPLALALANRVLGNPLAAPALEATLVGPSLRFTRATQIALSGASAPAKLNGIPVAFHETIDVAAGDVLEIGAAEQGMRTYLAVAGGLVVDWIFGSASTYLPAAFGGYQGRSLEKDDVLEVASSDEVQRSSTPKEFRPACNASWALRASPGGDFADLDTAQQEQLFASNWLIGNRADRMGLAVEGTPLGIGAAGHRASTAVFPGTLQCPAGGQLYLLSVDAQTTGGYAQLLQVARVDRHMLGQLRPGDRVRFLHREPQQAATELRAMHNYWRRWLPGIETVV
jgi:biotin-dependent carboxylase-like uncharacterized protein